MIKISEKTLNYNAFHGLFKSIYSSRFAILLFGLIIWIICPIIGIIPILLYSQIYVSTKTFCADKHKYLNILNLNLLCILLVLLTITITSSTRETSSDLEAYVDYYSIVKQSGLLNLISETSIEPVAFIVPSILNFLFNPSSQVFLLTQSLTMNLGFIVLARTFMPSYYPTIILLNVTSTNYFIQLHLMRQFYSYIFIVAFLYIVSLRGKIITGALALMTHSGSLPFVLLGIISLKLNKIIPRFKSITKLLFSIAKLVFSRTFLIFSLIVAVSILPVFFSLMQSNSSLLGNFFPYLEVRVVRYSTMDYSLSSELWKSVFLDLIFLLPVIFTINYRRAGRFCYTWSIAFLLLISFLISFYLFLPFVGRFIFFLSGLSGFFYTIIFDSNKITHKTNSTLAICLIAIVTKVLYFLYTNIKGSLLFTSEIWDGTPVYANIFDYVDYFLKTMFS